LKFNTFSKKSPLLKSVFTYTHSKLACLLVSSTMTPSIVNLIKGLGFENDFNSVKSFFEIFETDFLAFSNAGKASYKSLLTS